MLVARSQHAGCAAHRSRSGGSELEIEERESGVIVRPTPLERHNRCPAGDRKASGEM